MKNKRILILISLLLILGISTVFGLWFGQINAPDDQYRDGNINIGDASDVDTIIDVNDVNSNLTLVPVGTAILSDGNVVEYKDLQFRVRWREELNRHQTQGIRFDATLNVSKVADSITLDESIHHLVNLTFNPTYEIELEHWQAIIVNVRVTLTRPANQAEYNLLAGESFSFRMRFSLTNIIESDYPPTESPDIDNLFALALARVSYLYAYHCPIHRVRNDLSDVLLQRGLIFFYRVGELPNYLDSPGSPLLEWNLIRRYSNSPYNEYIYYLTITIYGETRSFRNNVEVHMGALVVLVNRDIHSARRFTSTEILINNMNVRLEYHNLETRFRLYQVFDHSGVHANLYIYIYYYQNDNLIGVFSTSGGNFYHFASSETIWI